MEAVTAQLSLYPLGQALLGPAISAAVEALREEGLDVWEGSMSTLVAGDLEAICSGIRAAFRAAGDYGDAVLVVTLSNGCPVPAALPAHRPAEHERGGS
jgi:uncharacterized protein YqgV (UPF0045/DUF77 family)